MIMYKPQHCIVSNCPLSYIETTEFKIALTGHQAVTVPQP